MMLAGDLLDRFMDLPVADLDEVLPGRFLVLAPHPDDESLGCGGLIAEACRRGRPPLVAILTDGAASHPGSQIYPPARVAALRELEVRQAVAHLGLPQDRLFMLGAPDGKAPHRGIAVASLAARIAVLAKGCDAILTSWRHDPHCDHVSAWHTACEAAHLTGARVFEYPVWGWTLPPDHALPNLCWRGWRFDIAQRLGAKRRAIAAHRSQHGAVITDDPDGFILSAKFLSLFDRPFECLVAAA
jgi:LmbE family N-acetylglucosaminyl deacetylase